MNLDPTGAASDVAPPTVTTARARELLAAVEMAEEARFSAMASADRPTLDATADELEAATRHLIENDDGQSALRMVAGLGMFWQDAGRVDQGRRLTEWVVESARAVAHGDAAAHAVLARALLTASELAFRQGDQDAARRFADNCLAMVDGGSDPRTAGLALIDLARTAYRDGDAPSIDRFAREALDAAPSDPIVRRGALHMLAWAAHTAGDLPLALARFHESLDLRRAMGDPFSIAVELGNLGDLALEQGDTAAAERYLHDSLRLAREAGSAYLMLAGLLSATRFESHRGDRAAAVRFYAAAKAGYQTAGLQPDPGDADGLATSIDEARAALGADYDPLWNAGAALSIEAAIDEALARSTR